MPKKQVAVTVYIDPALLAWFQAQGDECEQHIVAALRIYVAAHMV